MEAKKTKLNFMNIISIIGLIATGVFIFYGYKIGLFSSAETFRKFIQDFGIWAALIYILIQIISIVVPILPTSLGCVASIIIFGPWLGFLYSYIGICVGSILAFLLSKRYGRYFVKGIIGIRAYDKYINWIDKGKKFDKMFALAIFFPGAPDDLLCYIAGLTQMRIKKFVSIILLGKPMSIAIFSIGISTVIHYLFYFVRQF